MSTVASLWVKLGLDSEGFNKGLKDAGSKAQNFGKGMMQTGAGLTAGVTLPLLGLGAAAVKGASDAEEAQNAVNVVFQDSANIIQDYAKTVAETGGISSTEFKQMAITSGSFLQGLGFDAEEAAKKTLELTQTATDLGSILNLGTDEGMSAFTAALKGEYEQMEKLGIKMNATSIEQKALEMGLGEVTVSQLEVSKATLAYEKALEKAAKMESQFGQGSDESRDANNKLGTAFNNLEKATAGTIGPLTDKMKATAALAIIQEKAAYAEGDFAKTSEGFANSSKIVTAQLKDAAEVLGQQLLPVALQLVGWATDMIAKFQALGPEQQKWLVWALGAAAAIGPLVTIIGGIVTAFGAIASVGAPIILIVLAIAAAIAFLVYAWKNNLGDIQGKAAEFWAILQPILQRLGEWLAVAIPAAIQTMSDFWTNTLLPAITSIWEFFTSYIFPIMVAVADVLSAVFGLAITVVAGYIQNVFIPQIKLLWEWFSTKILPIIQSVAQFLLDKLFPGVEGISGAVSGLIDWLGKLADGLRNITLPDWLTPGSPTPFELGLLGINNALKKVSAQGLPGMTMGLQMDPLGASAMGEGNGMLTAMQEMAYEQRQSRLDEQRLGRAIALAVQGNQ